MTALLAAAAVSFELVSYSQVVIQWTAVRVELFFVVSFLLTIPKERAYS